MQHCQRSGSSCTGSVSSIDLDATITSHSISALTPGTDYRVRLRAVSIPVGAGYWGGWRNYHTHHRPESTATPTVMTSSSTALSLVWTATYSHGSGAAAVDYYQLETIDRGVGSGSGTGAVTTRSASTTSFIDSPLAPDQNREFRVRAHNAYGFGAWSAYLAATSDPTAPTLPSAPSMSQSRRTSASLYYTWPVATPNGYPVIEYRVSVSGAGGSNPWSSPVSTGMTRSYNATGLLAYTTYRLKVSARSATMGWGVDRMSSSYKTLGYPSAPGSPAQRADYGPISNITTVWVEWGAAQKRYDYSTYMVYDIEYNGVVSAVGSDRYKVFINQPEGTAHNVRVRARNALGPGPWSALVEVRTEPARIPATPAAPTLGPYTNGDTGITQIPIRWTEPESLGLPVLEYRVYVDDDFTNPASVVGTYYVGRGYDPSSSHSFRVSARNMKGWSDISSNFSLTTNAAVPPSVVTNVWLGGLPARYYAPTALNLIWAVPSQWAQTGSAIVRYGLRTCVVTTGTCSEQNVSSAVKLMSNLAHETTFMFQFRSYAENNLASGWSAVYNFSTAAGQLPSAPGTPTQSNPPFLNNATGIYASWTSSTGFGMPITMYRIQYDAMIGTSQWISIGKSTSYLHRNLLPSQTHTYRVQAYTAIGWGPSSPTGTLVTGAGRPPDTPARVRMDVPRDGLNNITSISIVWAASASDLPATYYVLVNGTTTRYAGDRTSYVLRDVYPGSSAIVAVQARSSLGNSAWSTTVNMKADDPLPPLAPANVRQGQPVPGIAPSTQAVATWDTIETWGLPLMKLQVVLNAGTSWETTRTLTCPCSSQYAALQLYPQSTHTFTLFAQNARGWSPGSNTCVSSLLPSFACATGFRLLY